MALIVCPNCGEYHDRKAERCPSCVFPSSETKKIEKAVLDIHNEFRYNSSGFFNGRKKEIFAICESTRMSYDIAKKFLDNMEHPKDFSYKERSFFDEGNIRSMENLSNKYSKDSNVVRCPKCHSTSISYQGKISYGRAAVGGFLAGGTGAVLGGLTGKKGYAVCLNCGKRWKV